MIKKYYFKEVGSTNDVAKELLEKEDLLIVQADYQTKGRGRNENKWFGNACENIFCSFGIRHKKEINIDQVIILQAIGAMIVANAIRDEVEYYFKNNNLNNFTNFRIKYPNDVMVEMPNGEFGKICGVLAEHSFQGDRCSETILGIGVNVNQTEFQGITANTPFSLKLLLKKEFSIKNILDKMISNFIKLYDLDYDKLFDKWKEELNFENKIAKVKNHNDEFKILELMKNGEVKLKNLLNNEILLIDNGDSIRYDLQF